MPEKTRNSIDNFFNLYKLNGVENNKETNSYSSSQSYKENKNANLIQNNFETGLDKVSNNNTNTEIKPIKLPKVKTEKIDNNYESPKLLNINTNTSTSTSNTNDINQTDNKLTPGYFNTGEKYTPTNGEKKAGDWLVANGVLGSREEQENMRRNFKNNYSGENNQEKENNLEDNQVKRIEGEELLVGLGLPGKGKETYSRYSPKQYEETKLQKNPNYNNFKETEEYYKDLGLDYNFRINTRSENYDENKAIIKQENIINILGNKDLLHEVVLYPNGEEYSIDENGKKVKNTPITMYQIWEEEDTGAGQYLKDTIIREQNKGQCAYLVSKLLNDAFPIDKYPTLKNEKGFPEFSTAKGASSLISIADREDTNGNKIFDKSNVPTAGSIYANPNEEKTDGKGHVAIVANVKKINEKEYQVILLEQNALISIDGKNYFPIKDTDSKNHGDVRINPRDTSLVMGQRTITINIDDGITFISKNKN